MRNIMVLPRAIPPWGGQPDRNPFSRWENSSVSNCKASIYHSRINSTERKGNSACKLAWVHLKAYYKPYEIKCWRWGLQTYQTMDKRAWRTGLEMHLCNWMCVLPNAKQHVFI